MKILLAVRNQGHVPSFKNAKRVMFNRQTQKPFLGTRKDVKEWMERCIQSFESQLFLATQTGGPGILTGQHQRSLIASSLPLDDSREWIAELVVISKDAPKGSEGATVIIEQI